MVLELADLDVQLYFGLLWALFCSFLCLCRLLLEICLWGVRGRAYGEDQKSPVLRVLLDLHELACRLTSCHGIVGLLPPLPPSMLHMLPSCHPSHSYKPLPRDDPKQRRPDITKARAVMDWEPKVALREGLTKTIE